MCANPELSEVVEYLRFIGKGHNPALKRHLLLTAADEIEVLQGQVAAALDAVNRGLTYRPGAPGGFEVTNPHALILAWGILAVDQREAS